MPPLPSLIQNPSDFTSKQDIKDTISKQTILLKHALKYRNALNSLATVVNDFAMVLNDAGRSREFIGAAGVVDRTGTIRKCGEAHENFARKLREMALNLEKEFEMPMFKNMEIHNVNFTNIEKNLVKVTKESNDRIKRAENDAKKKRNYPSDHQAAIAYVGSLQLDHKNLKFVHQANLFAESVRHFMTFHNQCSALMKLQSDILGSQSESAGALFRQMGIFLSESVMPGKVPSPATTLPVNAGKTLRDRSQNELGSLRRSSLDSLADEYHKSEKLQQKTTFFEESATLRAQSAHGQARQVTPTTMPRPALARLNDIQSNSTTSLTREKKSVHFTSADKPVVLVQNDDSVVNGDLEDEDPEAIAIDVQPTITAALTTLYPQFFTDPPKSPIDNAPEPEIKDAQQTVSVSEVNPQELMRDLQTTVVIQKQQSKVRLPTVYFPPQADVQSQMGSVVGEMADEELEMLIGEKENKSVSGSTSSGASGGSSGSEKSKPVEMVIAVHDFTARSGKEMGLVKGDVLTVRKRQGTWIYGTKIMSAGESSDQDRFRRGPPQPTQTVGWIPVAFVTKYVTS